jgi:hypothetical protein
MGGTAVTVPQPGDVLLTRGTAWTSKVIRFGAALLDRPNTYNHVIVIHHRDNLGVLWGVEARAEGVGWIDLTRTMRSRWVLTNADQPKTPEDRVFIAKTVEGAIAAPYDWTAIVAEAFEALRIDEFWRPAEFPEDGRLPYGTICSALADWAYERRGLPNPGGAAKTRTTTPSDWQTFLTLRPWEHL